MPCPDNALQHLESTGVEWVLSSKIFGRFPERQVYDSLGYWFLLGSTRMGVTTSDRNIFFKIPRHHSLYDYLWHAWHLQE